MEKPKRYNYIRLKLAGGTRQAVLFSLLSFAVTVAAVVLSAAHGGEGPMYLGAMGLLAIVLALASLSYANMAAHEENKNARPAKLAAALSALLLLFWTVMIALGIRLVYY